MNMDSRNPYSQDARDQLGDGCLQAGCLGLSLILAMVLTATVLGWFLGLFQNGD